MARLNAWCAAVAAALCVAAAAPAQTHPLAALSGRVTGPDGAPLAGVLVVASSPALQGVRDTTTTEAGDYRIPFLPPGDYQIGFRRDGYQELRAHRTLRAAETARLDAELELAAVAETITVDAEPASLAGRSFALATSHTADLLDRVPGERDPRAAALLAPGVAASGSDGVTIAGAMPYENLWLVDGVAVKDRVFGQPRPFAIEDAIDQTSTAVAGISAEYGRFSGGVVNVVTRAGGNRLAGSLRATLANDAWRSLTPHEREALAADPRDDAVVPTWETALGGPLVRDRLWYFLAARREEIARAETLAYTDLPYRYGAEETRLDGKLTWTPRAGRSLRAGWREIDTRERNRAEGVVMDHASLGSVTTPEDLLSLHATSALAGNLFVEGQVSRRRRTLIGLGAHTTDRIGGTLLQDGSRGAFWGSPRFCGVCGERPGELRRTAEEDRAAVAKVRASSPGRAPAPTTSSSAARCSRSAGAATPTRPAAASSSSPRERCSSTGRSIPSSAPTAAPSSSGRRC